MLTPDRWERVKDLFDRALDSAPGARVGLLEAECSNDPEVFAEVQRLLEQWEAAGEFLANPIGDLNVPAERAPGFAEGDIVAQRFRIVRLIGAGGMGEVYEAEDQDLGERVALKTVRIDRIGDPLAQRRLRREALLARRVTHPNVCRIFDVGRHVSTADGAELAILSMELLEGQTLAARLKERGRLSEAEALPIVEQMCAALEAAHTAGVVHRDFKPSNVMLVGERVVVTDFGLALSDRRRVVDGWASGTTLTHSGQLMGTPEYMAPEQIRTGEATPRSDIYSLGVVMYEMVTGVRPAAGSTGIDEILKRFLEPVRPPRELCPGLSRRWEAVILRCLEREAGARWGSAGEVVRGLRAWAVFSILRARMMAQGARRIAAAIAMSTFALALGVAGLRFLDKPAVESKGASVLLASIQNSTGDRELDGVGTLLERQLNLSGRFRVIEDSRVRQIQTLMKMPARGDLDVRQAREVALRDGATAVIYGTLTRLGPEYVLGIRIEAVGGSPLNALRSWKKEFSTSSKTDLIVAVHDAAIWLRERAGETPLEIANVDRPVEDVTTGSWAALRLYRDALLQSEAKNVNGGIALLRQALSFDPKFVMAWRALADLEIREHDYRNGYEDWQKAISLLDEQQVTSRESLRLRGMYYEDTSNHAEAEQQYRALLQLYPDDPAAEFYLASVLARSGRLDEAIARFENQLRRNPKDGRPISHLVTLNLAIGNHAAAKSFIELQRKNGNDSWAESGGWRLEFLEGKPDHAEAHLRSLAVRKEPEWAGRGAAEYASFLEGMGQRGQARVQFQRAIEQDRISGKVGKEAVHGIAMAFLEARDGNLRRGLEQIDVAVSLDPSPPVVSLAACFYNEFTQPARLNSLIRRTERWPELPLFDSTRAMLRSLVKPSSDFAWRHGLRAPLADQFMLRTDSHEMRRWKASKANVRRAIVAWLTYSEALPPGYAFRNLERLTGRTYLARSPEPIDKILDSVSTN